MSARTLPTPTAVAAVFASVLKEWLTPVEFLQMRMLNAREESDLVCHSHDYCDANMAMAAAFEKLGVDPLPDIDNDGGPSDEAIAATNLWNDAWEAAMPALGRGAQTLATTDDRYCMVDQLWWDTRQKAVVTQAMVDAHVKGPVGIMVFGQAKEVAHG